MLWEYELNEATIDGYKVNKEIIDDILNELEIRVCPMDETKCFIIPKKVAFIKPNPEDWFECDNNIRSIIDTASALLWLESYIGGDNE